MSRTRVAWLVLVLLALGLSVAHGLRSEDPPAQAAVDLGPLRAAAALDPCPAGLGDALPDLTLPCLGGGPDVRLRSAPPGRPTLVNVYGSWCEPCQREMPVLVEFSQLAAGKVALVGVDTVDEPSLALRFAKDFGQHWPAVVDDDKSVLLQHASGPPVTLFLDAEGREVHVQAGEFRSLEDLRAKVRRYLGVSV